MLIYLYRLRYIIWQVYSMWCILNCALLKYSSFSSLCTDPSWYVLARNCRQALPADKINSSHNVPMLSLYIRYDRYFLFLAEFAPTRRQRTCTSVSNSNSIKSMTVREMCNILGNHYLFHFQLWVTPLQKRTTKFSRVIWLDE